MCFYKLHERTITNLDIKSQTSFGINFLQSEYTPLGRKFLIYDFGTPHL
jgi:hypothetical protein